MPLTEMCILLPWRVKQFKIIQETKSEKIVQSDEVSSTVVFNKELENRVDQSVADETSSSKTENQADLNVDDGDEKCKDTDAEVC